MNNILQNNRVLFVHRSVGNNILDAWEGTPNSNMLVRKEFNTFGGDDAGVYDFDLGINNGPIKKIDKLSEVLLKQSSFDVVIFKLCYVDITRDTDVADVLTSYKEKFSQLENLYPSICFIHFTVPLKMNKTSFKTHVKKLFGDSRIWEYADNISRNRFNQGLRKLYAEGNQIFDIAKLESTDESGKECCFKYKGEKFEVLCSCYTDDGGHLNRVGSSHIARELDRFLGDL